ncbi:hypothetical protein MKW98_017873 [Papaver atlanticum]|uniref:Mitochondrial inner membrane protease subunit 2 n=1 Tax=Papaver atlanticum TaxID=357466 RepID=A0AAD4TC97_9MAGN|nr:hypothetical protein MKW98_017873 [Papaver atlanticum]
MGALNFLWDTAKKTFTAGLITLTVSDRYASIAPIRGLSMHPTFNPNKSTFMGLPVDDRVLIEKFCLEKYKVSHGDVIVFRSPINYKEKHIKRVIALPGDWIQIPNSYDTIRIPDGHCWVEGDNSASTLDSRSFGPIPLGLLQGRATHIVWPPRRVGKVEQKMPEGRLRPY